LGSKLLGALNAQPAPKLSFGRVNEFLMNLRLQKLLNGPSMLDQPSKT